MDHLGDMVEVALHRIGLTHSMVSNWLGKPCDCDERREKLNALGQWAARVARGKIDNARDYLERIIRST